MELTSEKCELIGLHTGDGTLYQTHGGGKVWELRGGLGETEFYDKHVHDLLLEIFNISFKTKYRSGGSYGVQTCNKELINFLIDVGFPVGSKVYTTKVPNFIFNTSRKNKLSFVRGLFDTDGCISLDRKYPRITFGFASVYLRDTLKLLLDELGFRPTISYHKSFRNGAPCHEYNLKLFGKKQVNKFFKEVSPKNPKHLNKQFLKK